MKRLLQCAAFFATLFVTTAAFAATALVTTDLHMRTGPSTGYPIVASMPNGAVVNVGGCTRGYGWCRVDWDGYRGWASAHYLAFRNGRYRHRAFSRYGAEIGIPLIAGAVIGNALGDHHHGHHRRDYKHRHHGQHHAHNRHQRHKVQHLKHQRKHLRKKLHHARHSGRKHHRRAQHHKGHHRKINCHAHSKARACRHHR